MGIQVHASNPNTKETEAGVLLSVPSQSEVHSEFKANLDFIARPCLRNKQKIESKLFRLSKCKVVLIISILTSLERDHVGTQKVHRQR